MDSSVIKGPVGFLVGLVIWLIVMPLILGAINGWYLLTVDSCVIDSERVDRVVNKGTHANAEDAWKGVTSVSNIFFAQPVATTAYTLNGEAGFCEIGQDLPSGGTPRTPAVLSAQSWYTPSGSVVTSIEVPASSSTDTADVTGGKWEPVSGLFTAGGLGSLIRLVLQAAGLAPPIAIMAVLGSFGQSFIKKMGGNPIIAAVVTVITLLLVATLLNSLVPFVADAFESINPNRFAMFDGGLGNVSVIIRRFYGVVLVASLIMIAWSVLKSMKGGNALSGQGDQRM